MAILSYIIRVFTPLAWLLPLLYLAWLLWIKTHQLEAIQLLADLKRSFRRWIVKRYGEKAAKIAEKELRAKAGNNPSRQKAVDIVMRMEREKLIEKYGTICADKFLGKPGTIEERF